MGADVLRGVGASTDLDWSARTAVLLEVSGLDSRERVVCRSLLPNTDDGVEYCRFSFRRSVADQFTEISQYNDELPDHGLFVQVRGGIEDVFELPSGVSDDSPVCVKVVNDPSNMTKLGMTLTEVLDDASDDGGTAICFDSLTALLQYVSLEEAIQFVSLTKHSTRIRRIYPLPR
ncbi:DUF7504 family protein [Halobaculum rarum]|uniref:DUF7504 family protein n=1 Tax=Halobaculum rarum TaxID=3075122 RepID=UPI003D68CB0A